MQASTPSYKKWGIPVAGIVGLAVILFLSNRPVETPDGLPVITDDVTYADTVRRAAVITQPRFEAYDRGDDITETDKAELRKAARMYDAANVLHANQPGFFLDAGRAYLIIGDYDSAENRLLQCVSNAGLKTSDLRKEGLADAKYLLAQVRGLKGEWQSSLEFATEADKMRPGVATYITAKASAELQLGKLEQAKKDLSLALQIDPFYKRALQLRRLMEIDAQGR